METEHTHKSSAKSEETKSKPSRGRGKPSRGGGMSSVAETAEADASQATDATSYVVSLFSTHPEHEAREAAMAKQESIAMHERARCQCGPVDQNRRRQVERALKKQTLKRAASVVCSKRHDADT